MVDLQKSYKNELVRVAGGESKRINLVSKEGDIILTLPSALSNGSVIDITKDKEAAKTIKMLNTPHQGVLDPAKEKYNNTAIENKISCRPIEKRLGICYRTL